MGVCPLDPGRCRVPASHALIPLPGPRAHSYALRMAIAIEDNIDVREVDHSPVDALGFLAGKRYTCYCGRSVVGSIMCGDCAEEMAEYYNSARRRRLRMADSAG
jgi:hypothetical protein